MRVEAWGMLYALLEWHREGQQWGAEAQSQGKGYSEQQGSGYFDYSSQCLTHHSLWLEGSWRKYLHCGMSVSGSFLRYNFFVFNFLYIILEPINEGQDEVYMKLTYSDITHSRNTVMGVTKIIKLLLFHDIMMRMTRQQPPCHVNLAASHTSWKDHHY